MSDISNILNNTNIKIINANDTLFEAFTASKVFKYPIVGMYKGYILGTDESFSALAIQESELYSDSMIAFDKKDLMYAKSPEDFTYNYNGGYNSNIIVKVKNKETGDAYNKIIYIDGYKNLMNHLFTSYWDIDNRYKVGYEEKSIQNTPIIESYKNSPASFGSVLYIPEKCNKFAMYIPIGSLPLNKSDKLHIKIYEVNESIFISRFTIDKAKKGIIDIYMTYFYII